MKKTIKYLPQAASWFFILLFIYAGVSKMLDFENFQVQIGQSPLLSAWAGFVSYAVIAAELLICGLLVYRGTQLAGLYASFTLMVAFTVYIWLILNFSDFVPCSCGGILEEMGWTEHLLFNMACVVLAAAAIWITERNRLRPKGRILTSLGVLLAAAFGLLVALFYSSEHIIKKENNFTRRFLMNPITETKAVTLDSEHYYFAGSSEGHIFLGSRALPQNLTTYSTSLSERSVIKIKPDNLKHTFRNIRVQVKAPHYYFYDGTVPVIYRGRLGAETARTLSYQDAFFTQLVALDSLRFALRTQDAVSKSLTLALLETDSPASVKLFPEILSRQTEGLFDMDGKLAVNQDGSKLIYTYTYRNRFIVMDGGLKVLRELQTIDTTETAKVKSTRLSDGRYKMTAPPLKVNAAAYAYNDLLFNQSGLMGKYESPKSWKKAKVIDVYSTSRAHYVGSFYLYNRTGVPLTDFMISGGYLYVLFGSELVQYKINYSLLKYMKEGEAENLKKSRH
ncbi:tellurium resistance protein TerC [Chryseobacterium sp. cx-311]|uniref:DoxX family protein n=1 Tax=Marnyiella aurantia TaxID=2758037 RepID=UPI001AEAB87B|nr:MauE/DoxX family redox-associated membrane protein [Marnyiella aurantia]MBP0613950.1 tellurium resistance protein TerC [Marnyiella aurantia]